MLTLQLRELEEDGLVKRTVFAEVPPRVEYELTTFGRSLEPVLLGLRDWGERYKRRLQGLGTAAPQHAAGGVPAAERPPRRAAK
jgi:DNA-binding HxlR family transcriptional regulator